MAGRRFLLAVVLLAAVLHGISIARSLLPAQDGLKCIRIARHFQNDPWPDVVVCSSWSQRDPRITRRFDKG